MLIQIFPNFYIGTAHDYENDVRFREKGAVVHACKIPYPKNALGYSGNAAPKAHLEYWYAYRDDNKRLLLNLIDAPSPDGERSAQHEHLRSKAERREGASRNSGDYIPSIIIDEALSFIDLYLSQNENVLVHCNQGQSRSPGIGLLYLRQKGQCMFAIQKQSICAFQVYFFVGLSLILSSRYDHLIKSKFKTKTQEFLTNEIKKSKIKKFQMLW